MLFQKYDFKCVFTDNAVLPYYKGSTFRGAFGNALKRVACALKKQDCSDCILREKCIYSITFETDDRNNAPNGNKKIAAVPHPYVIEPPLTSQTDFDGGSTFCFSLLLFGEVNQYLPYFIYAFIEMGKTGIGKNIGRRRARFKIELVSSGEKPVFSSTDQNVQVPEPVSLKLMPVERAQSGQLGKRIKLNFLTPLRLKHKNQFMADLPFHILVRAMLRRVSSLMKYHGDGEPQLDYAGLVSRAANIKVVRNNLKWFDWKRYSSRQDKNMLMGGIVGDITFEGDLDEYLPLFDFCQKVHIGKQTAFGLGMMDISL